MIIHHDSYPNNVNDNDEHPNDINNIDTDKNSYVRKKDTLRNGVNNSNKNSGNFKNKGSDNEDNNKIDTENNIHNFKFCYNFKLYQSAHIIQKYGESSPYAIQLVQYSNTNIFQRKLKHIGIRKKK